MISVEFDGLSHTKREPATASQRIASARPPTLDLLAIGLVLEAEGPAQSFGACNRIKNGASAPTLSFSIGDFRW